MNGNPARATQHAHGSRGFSADQAAHPVPIAHAGHATYIHTHVKHVALRWD